MINLTHISIKYIAYLFKSQRSLSVTAQGSDNYMSYMNRETDRRTIEGWLLPSVLRCVYFNVYF